MKKIYQYLAFAIGTIMLPLNETCYATQPTSTHMEKDEMIAEWSLPNAKEVYSTILASIPADNSEARNAFLSEVWQRKRAQIVKAMSSNPQEYPKEITAKVERLTDWNDESPELEDAKYAVQTYIQNQSGGFFYGVNIGAEYMREMISAICDFIELQMDLPEGHNLKTLLDSIKKIGIGCPGCALTWDLIMDIMRLASSKLMDNPNDQQTLEALDALLNTIKTTKNHGHLLAHSISGLPKVATEIAQSMRTMSTQLRSEFTPKDIDLLLKELEKRIDFTPFQKPKLREKLTKIRGENPKGIAEAELKTALLSILNDEKKINSLLKSIDREVSSISTTIDEQKGFGGKLSVFGGNSSTESQSSSASNKRAMLNEQERSNTRNAMQFFQQRANQH